MEILRIENLTKTYGEGDNKVEALKDINLCINKGEFVAIIGASGSGKSTLLHLLGGLDRATSGKVIIDEKSIYDYKDEELSIFRRRKVGFIFQFFNLIPVLDVEENIELPVILDNEKVDKDYLDEIITILNLQDRRTHLPSELSGGQQQRVSIGRALINKPSIILADEPTGNLDTKSTFDIMKIFQDINDEGATVIMVTHEPDVAKYTKRIVRFKDGVIVEDKPVEDRTRL